MDDQRSRNGAIIELVEVHKRFGALRVLDGIDLRIERGRTHVIIGASGTGKSVLLKHIIGLLKPDRGAVYYKGQRVDKLPDRAMPPIRRQFGFLFQLSALFDSMTVGQNVAFPLTQQTRKKRGEIDAIVAEKLAMVGLDGLQGKMPSQLSGGQKKRVALARAIALDPSVILYDEPTTGLDPIRADVINELILKLQRELGVTGIVVTHDMPSVYKVADKVVMLYEGKICFEGTCDEIRSSDDERVRRFIEGRAGAEDLRGTTEKE